MRITYQIQANNQMQSVENQCVFQPLKCDTTQTSGLIFL